MTTSTCIEKLASREKLQPHTRGFGFSMSIYYLSSEGNEYLEKRSKNKLVVGQSLYDTDVLPVGETRRCSPATFAVLSQIRSFPLSSFSTMSMC